MEDIIKATAEYLKSEGFNAKAKMMAVAGEMIYYIVIPIDDGWKRSEESCLAVEAFDGLLILYKSRADVRKVYDLADPDSLTRLVNGIRELYT